jgi:outer membrane protein OmpA-like peptidoglycan-associated protein
MRTLLLFTLSILLSIPAFGQPGTRFHTNSKKAIKHYEKAMERSRAALAPGSDLEAARKAVEEDLLKCLDIDPDFAEAERVIAALRFDEGSAELARDHYAHYLGIHGPDFIRDHLLWAESARHALDPQGMKDAMAAMRAIPGVMEGPDVEKIIWTEKDAEFMSMSLLRPLAVTPMALPAPVSTMEDEYFPSVWLAGDALIFTRKVTDERWQQGQEDLYVTRRNAEGWELPQPLRGLNTLENEGAATLSGDGNLLCFTMCKEADRSGRNGHQGSCDLYMSESVNGQWTRPQNIASINTAGWESQPCLSPDGQTLYFTRGSGKGGRRKYDLFASQRGEDGGWGPAYRLGGTINSAGKEMRPFIHPDGRHFYFASDGRPGMGGMDIFMCTLGEGEEWGHPVNLGWPLNTHEDETGLVVGSDGVTAYFSRQVEGQLDVHEVILPEEVAADPTAALVGILRSQEGSALRDGVIRLMDRETGRSFARAEAGPDGGYHVPVPMDRTFVVIAEAPGFMLASESIEPGEVSGMMTRDFSLSPLEIGAEVVLRNVFFESGSAGLDRASGAELTRVGQWLADRPEIRLEVGGHTDDVGSDAANLSLSTDRAKAVRDALIEAGAQPEQLAAQGYGRSKPAVESTTEEARRMNRRTTLTVLPKAD